MKRFRFACRSESLYVQNIPVSRVFKTFFFFIQGRPVVLGKKIPLSLFFSTFGFRLLFFQSFTASKSFGSFNPLFSFFKFPCLVLEFVFGDFKDFCSKSSTFFSELENRKLYPISFSLDGYIVPFSNFSVLSRVTFDRVFLFRVFNFLPLQTVFNFFFFFFLFSKLSFFLFSYHADVFTAFEKKKYQAS